MNPWITCKRWADEGLTPLSVVLLEGAEPAGLSAVMAAPGREAEGPLTLLDFWAGDWAEALKAATAVAPPEGGRVLAVGGRQYYVSGLESPRSALVLGGGHVGRAVCEMLRFLDFEVTLMDDRREFLQGLEEPGLVAIQARFEDLNRVFPDPAFQAVVIVTRGHAQDTACLRRALAWPRPPAYLGMIGSRSRAAETLDLLAREGHSREALAGVHTPIGLPINAQTPREIAVSIAAEIIQALGRPPLRPRA